MHVTASLAGKEVEVEVGENCRTIEALKKSIAKELPQLCVEGFDVSVGGRSLENDEDVVSLQESMRLDVAANTRGLSVLALREDGYEVTEYGLEDAVAEGDVALCTLYLDAGVHCDGALFSAVRRDERVELCKLFLSRNYDVDCVDDEGCTLMHYAVVYRSREMCEFLFERSHNWQRADSHGRTPLHTAVFKESRELCELLLDQHHDMQCVDHDGHTPLHLAVRIASRELCELFLDRKHDVQCADKRGCTPLHLAVQKGSLEICKILLDRNHDVRCADDQGRTPLQWAAKGDNREIFKLLLDRSHDA